MNALLEHLALLGAQRVILSLRQIQEWGEAYGPTQVRMTLLRDEGSYSLAFEIDMPDPRNPGGDPSSWTLPDSGDLEEALGAEAFADWLHRYRLAEIVFRDHATALLKPFLEPACGRWMDGAQLEEAHRDLVGAEAYDAAGAEEAAEHLHATVPPVGRAKRQRM